MTGGTHNAQEMYKAFLNQFLSPGLRALGFTGSAGRYDMVCDDAGYCSASKNQSGATRPVWSSRSTSK
jgi:hypothetical protein